MQPTVKRIDKARLFADLGYQPHPAQEEIHRSSAPRRIVACGVRFGKSLCAAMEGLAAAMAPSERSVGWIAAPTYDLSERVFNQLVLVAASHLRHRIVSLREHERVLVLRNLGGGVSEVRGKSADNPISLLGEGLDFVIVDEAARLKPSIWQSHLSQRLIDRRGWALLISTPKGKGYFYDLFRRGQPGGDPDYESWNWPSWSNPLLDRDLIEQERARLPERVFREQYGAEFIEGSGAVFRKVRECATAAWQKPVPDGRYVAGLDLAKVEDFTVLVIVSLPPAGREEEAGFQPEVVFVDRFHRQDWAIQVNRIRAACERYDQARILCDSTGAGEPVFESLKAAGCRVAGYGFTAASKAQLINNLALMLEQEKIRLPKPELWPEGIDELEAFEYSVTDAGNVRTGAPSGVHDDCVIALALAAWNASHERPRPSVCSVGGPYTENPGAYRSPCWGGIWGRLQF